MMDEKISSENRNGCVSSPPLPPPPPLPHPQLKIIPSINADQNDVTDQWPSPPPVQTTNCNQVYEDPSPRDHDGPRMMVTADDTTTGLRRVRSFVDLKSEMNRSSSFNDDSSKFIESSFHQNLRDVDSTSGIDVTNSRTLFNRDGEPCYIEHSNKRHSWAPPYSSNYGMMDDSDYDGGYHRFIVNPSSSQGYCHSYCGGSSSSIARDHYDLSTPRSNRSSTVLTPTTSRLISSNNRTVSPCNSLVFNGLASNDQGSEGGGGRGSGRQNGNFLSVETLRQMGESSGTCPSSPVSITLSERELPTSRRVSTVTLSGQQNVVQIPTENGPMVLQLVLPRQSADNGQSSLAPPPNRDQITTVSESYETNNPENMQIARTSAIPSNAVVPVSTSTVSTVNSMNSLVKQDSHRLPGHLDGQQSTIGAETRVRIVPLPPLPTSEEDKRIIFRRKLTTLLSCIYAIFIVMLGGVVYVADTVDPSMPYAEIFTIYLTIVGLAWLCFLQFDIRFYLTRLSKWRKQEKRKLCGKDNDAYDKAHNEDDVKSSSKSDTDGGVVGGVERPPPDAYCFKTGPHSGSFYLKIGAAGFCFGHLIHEGLLLSRQILYFTNGEMYREECSDIIGTILQIFHPIFSFYQLFIIFKYSNIIINRFKEAARFATMHIIAANLCLWVNTIVRETVDSLKHDMHSSSHSHGSNATFAAVTISPDSSESSEEDLSDLVPKLLNATTMTSELDICLSKTILSAFTIEASPYLYPFTIEYSLLLVGVWFVMWYNIGNMEGIEPDAENIKGIDYCGGEDEEYLGESNFSSNLVIHVDCHSANRGLFAGLFVLLATVVSVIVFFVAMTNPIYTKTGVIINNVSDACLLTIMILSVLFAYHKTAQLDVNEHADPFLDDFLLFIALPCFFLYAIFNVVAGVAVNTPFNVVISILSIIQVVIQTPFIIDGLRRCSNSYLMRYKKPGRELITFLVVCNIACWILETFEIKSHETHSDKALYYGNFLWTLLSHVTLPLTLFYRFHSSVCLVDMWKSAYEPGDTH